MSDKVYMIQSRSTFICPKCGRKVPVHLSGDLPADQQGLALKCGCGYSWTSSMERRRYYRKPVNLKGRYHYSSQVELERGVVAGKFIGEGKMNVLDVSTRGLKMKLRKSEDFNVNDQVYVEFQLDDKQKTLIREKALVKNIDDRFVGGAFAGQKKGNRSLGFYLLG